MATKTKKKVETIAQANARARKEFEERRAVTHETREAYARKQRRKMSQ